MNTVVLEKNEQGMEIPVDVFAKMAKSRTLFINGVLDDKQATDIVATLLYLRSQKTKDPRVNLFLNCYCYDTRSILMVTDIIASLKDVPVRSVVVGEVSGLAPLLLTVSSESKACANTLITLSPLTPGMMYSKVEDLERYMKRIKSDEKRIFSLYAAKMKKDVKAVQELLTKDHYLTAKDAIALGLVDSIVEAK